MDKKNIIYGISVVILTAFAWLFVWPNVSRIDTLRESIGVEGADVIVLRQTQETIIDAKAFFARLSLSEKELVDLAIPFSSDKTNLINVLNNLAEDNGLVVNSISTQLERAGLQKGQSGRTLAYISITLNLEGSYNSFKEFIRSTEKSLRIFDIENIEIKSLPEEDLASFTVTGKAYYTK